MKPKWILAAIFLAAMAVPASAQVSIHIGIAPPPVVVERVVPAPSPGFIWVEGYWYPVGPRYRWCRGHWERPPYERAVWVQPRYERDDHGWRYHRGYWHAREVEARHDNGNHYGWERGRGHGNGHGHGHWRDD